jgi:hypothetical protein
MELGAPPVSSTVTNGVFDDIAAAVGSAALLLPDPRLEPGGPMALPRQWQLEPGGPMVLPWQ